MIQLIITLFLLFIKIGNIIYLQRQIKIIDRDMAKKNKEEQSEYTPKQNKSEQIGFKKQQRKIKKSIKSGTNRHSQKKNTAKRGRPCKKSNLRSQKSPNQSSGIEDSRESPSENQGYVDHDYSKYSPIDLIKDSFFKYFDRVGIRRGGMVFTARVRKLLRQEQKIGGSHIPPIQWDQDHEWNRKEQRKKVQSILYECQKWKFTLNMDQLLQISQMFPRQQTIEIYYIILQLCRIVSEVEEGINKEKLKQQQQKIRQYAQYILQYQPNQDKNHHKYRKLTYCFINGKYSIKNTSDLQFNIIHLFQLFKNIFRQLKILYIISKPNQIQFESKNNEQMQHNNYYLEQEEKKSYYCIGMMSGTSLDGIDLSYCQYIKSTGKKRWNYRLFAAKTYAYTSETVSLLKMMGNSDIKHLQYLKLEKFYSQIIVQTIRTFIKQQINSSMVQSIDFICLHGHTIFHQPNQSLTIQAGNINFIAAKLNIDVIGNFRELDVFREGQGAPLAPYGQEIFDCVLLNQKQKEQNKVGVFLNLGGVANIGFHIQGENYQRINYGTDIAFCNIIFNHYAELLLNKTFDEGGELGRKGYINKDIQRQFYGWNFTGNQEHKYPFSLAKEQIEDYLNYLQKLFNELKAKINKDHEQVDIFMNDLEESIPQLLYDMLRTYYEYLSNKIVQCCQDWVIPIVFNSNKTKNKLILEVICTGGGTYNKLLISLLQQKMKRYSYPEQVYHIQLKIPPKQIIQFKEAIIFGLLGAKQVENQRNCERGIGGMLVKGGIRSSKI